MQLRHIGIVCEDIERSLDFYCRLLGCSVARRMEESGPFISTILGIPNVEVETIKLALPTGEGQIELLKFKHIQNRSNTLTSQGLSHFAVRVDNLENLYNKFLAENISFISSPQISADGKAMVCFCQAPDNVYIELVELL